jgi:hypothetical protein
LCHIPVGGVFGIEALEIVAGLGVAAEGVNCHGNTSAEADSAKPLEIENRGL